MVDAMIETKYKSLIKQQSWRRIGLQSETSPKCWMQVRFLPLSHPPQVDSQPEKLAALKKEEYERTKI